MTTPKIPIEFTPDEVETLKMFIAPIWISKCKTDDDALNLYTAYRKIHEAHKIACRPRGG